MWAFNKNYELKPGVDLTSNNIEESESDEEVLLKMTPQQISDRSRELEKCFNVYTYDYLIKLTLEYCTEDSEIKVDNITKWRLVTSENIL